MSCQNFEVSSAMVVLPAMPLAKSEDGLSRYDWRTKALQMEGLLKLPLAQESLAEC